MKFGKLTIMVPADETWNVLRVFKTISDVEVMCDENDGTNVTARHGSKIVARLSMWDDNPIRITKEGVWATGVTYANNDAIEADADYAEWILEAGESGK